MQQFGVYEATTKLPDLIWQVLAGERVTITNRRVAVVDLVPSAQLVNRRTASAISAIKSSRDGAPDTPGTIDQATIAAQVLMLQVAAVGRECKIGAYDAQCLELARRLDLPLATLDKDLRKAAKKIGVEMYIG